MFSPNIAPPTSTVRAPQAMVATADSLATQAGVHVLRCGGSAVDGALAANAVLAVTAPHLCGMGGDLFALVHTNGGVFALDASGMAGNGASSAAVRTDGHRLMPFRHDIRTVTMPGCVDGWSELHARFGRLPMSEVLRPAQGLADDGFPASPLLINSCRTVDEKGRAALHELTGQAVRAGDRVRRPGVARTLAAIGRDGRAGFYEGEFGAGLVRLGPDNFAPSDLVVRQARWVEPLRAHAFGRALWTVPPPSQGYLTLAACAIADGLDLPDDPDDGLWAHLLVEAAIAAGYDRPDVLHDRADGTALLEAAQRRAAAMIDPARAGQAAAPGGDGDTTYLCVVDSDRMGVSLIQSNASGFGSWLVEPSTGINLHNRGLGFSLIDGHPGELAPARRPPHTLSPALVTDLSGTRLDALVGTMGGDAQPQILLQIIARLYRHGSSPAKAIGAGRFSLRGPSTGFDTWDTARPGVTVEGHASSSWARGLQQRGHVVSTADAWDSGFGHAHMIAVGADEMLNGSADPRAVIGSASGY